MEDKSGNQIRKKKHRDLRMDIRRQAFDTAECPAFSYPALSDAKLQQIGPALVDAQAKSPQIIQELTTAVQSNNFSRLQLLKALRQMTSRHLQGQIFAEYLRRTPLLLRFLIDSLATSNDEVLYECTWVFINLSYKQSEFDTQLFQDVPFLKNIKELLNHSNSQVNLQTIWFLSNFFQSKALERHRHQFIKNTKLLDIIQNTLSKEEPNKDELENAVECFRTFATLYSNNDLTASCALNKSAPKFMALLADYLDQDYLYCVIVKTFQHLLERDIPECLFVLHDLPTLGGLTSRGINSSENILVEAALNLCANLLVKDDKKITLMLVKDLLLLHHVHKLVKKYEDNTSITYSLLLVLQNAPVKQSYVLEMYTQQNLEDVIQFMDSQNMRMRLEATNAALHYMIYGGGACVQKAVEMKILLALRVQLNFKDHRLLITTMQCIEAIMESGDELEKEGHVFKNPYWIEFVEITGEAKLKEVINHPVESVYKLAGRLLLRYEDEAPEPLNVEPGKNEEIAI